MNITDKQRAKKRLDRLAWYLDNSIQLPGLNVRVGIDPLVGLLGYLLVYALWNSIH